MKHQSIEKVREIMKIMNLFVDISQFTYSNKTPESKHHFAYNEIVGNRLGTSSSVITRNNEERIAKARSAS